MTVLNITVLVVFITLVLTHTLSDAKVSMYPPAQPTYDAIKYTSVEQVINDSKRSLISVAFNATDTTASNTNTDYITMTRLDLVGNSKERGYAHGYLLTKKIVDFFAQMDEFYVKTVLSLDITQFPEEIQKVLRIIQLKGAAHAPEMFYTAMIWVYNKELQYIPQALIDEMDGIADGMCDNIDALSHEHAHICDDVDTLKNKIHAFNMFPELIRMQCTIVGAYGMSTSPQNNLIQLRALDFGDGPWVNNTIVYVHKKNPDNANNAFVSVAFPAFVGVITGTSQAGIGISQKVWLTDGTNDDEGSGLKPGSFQGLSDVFVLRNILEYSLSKVDAEAYLQSIPRTWGIWVGVGDYASMSLDIIGYQQASAAIYTDITMPSMSGQPYLPDITYVDKHTQPSWDQSDDFNGTLPTALTDFYGQINFETMKQIVQFHETGDVHAAVYDFSQKQMLLAIGKTNNSEGSYGDSCYNCAYNRPWVIFDLNELWA